MTCLRTSAIALSLAGAALAAGTASATPPAAFLWANNAGGAGSGTSGGRIAGFADGSTVSTTAFIGTMNFGPAGSITRTGGGFNMLVTKVDPSGTFAWVAQSTGGGPAVPNAVAALPDGSSIVHGAFTGNMTLGTWGTLAGGGQNHVFITKMNPDGTFAWGAKGTGTGGPGLFDGGGMDALPDGTALATGPFTGTMSLGATALTAGGNPAAYVTRVNPDGTFAWAVRAGGAGSSVYAFDIAALPDGSAFVVGSVRGTATFGAAGSVTAVGNSNPYIAKVNADGTFAWVHVMSGMAGTYGNALGVSVGADGAAVVTGWFNTTVTFGAAGPLTATGPYDLFVTKVNADGTFAWVGHAGGASDQVTSSDVTAFPDGSSILTGFFSRTINFGPAGVLTAAGTNDTFVTKVNGDGTFAWATQVQGGNVQANGITAWPDGSTAIEGWLSGTGQFGAAGPVTATGSGNFFATRLLSTPLAPTAPTAVAGNAAGTATVTIAPAAGGSITSYTVTADPGGRTCTVTAPATHCTVDGLAGGTAYTFTASATNTVGTGPASVASDAVTPTAPPAPSPDPVAPGTGAAGSEAIAAPLPSLPGGLRITPGRAASGLPMTSTGQLMLPLQCPPAVVGGCLASGTLSLVPITSTALAAFARDARATQVIARFSNVHVTQGHVRHLVVQVPRHTIAALQAVGRNRVGSILGTRTTASDGRVLTRTQPVVLRVPRPRSVAVTG